MITIITATYNAAATLPNNLSCIKSQTTTLEHLLIDGSSTDGTLDIIKTYVSSPISPLPRYISEPDKGIYDAMNKGIAVATGDIIGILNADDIYPSSDTLAKVVRTFSDPAVEACYGDLCYIRDNAIIAGDCNVVRYWRSGSFDPQQFYWGWMPPHPTFFVRRSVYERFGTFNLELGTSADYEIMLRFLLKHRIKTVYIPEVLVLMRTGGASNASLKARIEANHNDRTAWKVNDLKPYPWTLALKPIRKIPQWFISPPN